MSLRRWTSSLVALWTFLLAVVPLWSAHAAPDVAAGGSFAAVGLWWEPRGNTGRLTLVAGVRSVGAAGVQTTALVGTGECKAVADQPRGCRLRVRTRSIALEDFVVEPLLRSATLRYREGGSLTRVTWTGRESLIPGWRIERAATIGNDYVLIVAGLSGGFARRAGGSGEIEGARLPARQMLTGGIGSGGGAVAIICAGLPSGCVTRTGRR